MYGFRQPRRASTIWPYPGTITSSVVRLFRRTGPLSKSSYGNVLTILSSSTRFAPVCMQLFIRETWPNRRWNFLASLPQQARLYITEALRSNTAPNMSHIYDLAIEWAQNRQLSNQVQKSHPSSRRPHENGRNDPRAKNKARRDTPFPALAPPFSQNAGTNNNAAANNDAANHTPMDLDAMQQSANVRCYNCNERGHVAKDCKRARRTTKASPVSNGRTNGQRTYGVPRPQQVHTFEMESENSSNDNGDFFPQDLPDDYIPALDLEPLVSQEPTQQDERLTDDNDDPLYALVHEEMDTNPTYAIGLGPPNRDLHGSRAISVRALLDTGATSNYVTRDVARRAHAEFFRITPRDVVGAGKTTTSAFARMTLVFGGRIREDFMPMSWKMIRISVMMFFLDGSGCVFIRPQSIGTRTNIS
ncbi:hypothetical protein BC835DRAFT_882111 [Cytidiella melzeri]|nr:hypothetical protein BC835DRAFT_882111 [Cytidiella melzeri]